MSPATLPVRRKVLAYITSDDYLLVFRHLDFPEAGIQVPAGTVEPGEKLTAAVLRESWEETGLTGLTVAGFLERFSEVLPKDAASAARWNKFRAE